MWEQEPEELVATGRTFTPRDLEHSAETTAAGVTPAEQHVARYDSNGEIELKRKVRQRAGLRVVRLWT